MNGSTNISRNSVPVFVEEDRDFTSEKLPARFGKYTLVRRLATGGMAELFLAIQKSVAGFEKLVVIKRILPPLNQDPSFIDMFLHEARVAATLSHPNIVQIFDVGQVGKTYFIAMEHVHGEDLRAIVKQMRRKSLADFPIEHALSIVLGICSALAYAHDTRDLDGAPLHIVHRDISPQNVIVTYTGDVKIVDFGIAKSDRFKEETSSGKLKGKVPYMSPEQARGEDVDWRSDIFSAGVMLFELTTGRRLFKAESDYETLKFICEGEYPRPSDIVDDYPPELERVVMRALEKDPNNRFQSAREMQALLEGYIRRERIGASTLALRQFMQALFDDKLASQDEALVEDKQLADGLPSEQSPDVGNDGDTNATTAATKATPLGHQTPAVAPASAPPVTKPERGQRAAKRREPRALSSALTLAFLMGTLGAVGSSYWYVRHAPAKLKGQAASTRATNGVIAIATEPGDAKIWVNGVERKEQTPATISDLAIGRPVEIRVEKPGFLSATRSVSLTESEPSAAMTVSLERGTFSFTVTPHPALAGAGVIVDGKIYRTLTVDGVSAGEPHKVVAFAPGYTSQPLTLSAEVGETKALDIALVKIDGHKERPASSAASVLAEAKQLMASLGPKQLSGVGRLNVTARGGWCNIVIDGTPHGPTPVAEIQLSSGSHSVSCTPENQAPMTATVNVPADGTARYSFTIKD